MVLSMHTMVEEIKASVDPDATFIELRLWFTRRDVIGARAIHCMELVALSRQGLDCCKWNNKNSDTATRFSIRTKMRNQKMFVNQQPVTTVERGKGNKIAIWNF